MRRLLLIPLAAASLTWVGAMLIAPVVASHDDSTRHVSAAAYLAGSLICHQRSDRSFHLAGAQLPVCARCMGLYVGGALGVLGWIALAGVRATPSARARWWLSAPRLRGMLVAFATPTLFTALTAVVGLWDPDNALRAGLAIPLGAVVGMIVAAVSAGDLR